ncbi:7-cyano-7-deazaguanine synthase [Kitasatospora sp. NPDC088346]|uniref:7-cyano-7-deazaguanine synthase n=1 Tax=Kitasatospora sp. NPDC088346 TaxID=3364073 RepID=UPI0038259B8A
MKRIVAVVSGGLDSVVLAHHLRRQGHQLHLLSIDYGQRHRNEHDYAALAARRTGSTHHVVDVRNLATVLPGYSLTDRQVDVPDRSYTETGSVNVVPNRNVILFAIAFAHAAAVKADAVAVGAVAGDDATAPDSSAAFLDAFNTMERIATAGLAPPSLVVEAPFITMPKREVILLGQELGVDFTETWSCFKGRTKHCGVCAACQDRRKEFAAAGVEDPTDYSKEQERC